MKAKRSGLSYWKDRLNVFLSRVLERRWTNIGLRAKMGLLVEVGLIGLIAIFMFVGVSTARQNTEKILSERVMLARLSAATLDSSLRQIESVLVILSERVPIRDPAATPSDRLLALKDAFRQLSPASRGLYYFNFTGEIANTTRSPADNLSNQELIALKEAFKSSESDKSPWLVILPDDPPVPVIISSVEGTNGQPLAFLAVVLDLEGNEFAPLRQAIDLGATGKLDVIDASGRILISSHPERSSSVTSFDRIWSRLFVAGIPDIETCLGCAEGDSPESTDEVIAFAPLTQASWGVVVRQKASELMAPVNRLLVQTLLLGSITIVGALVLVWVTTNSVIKPVQVLKEASVRIAQGDLTTPIELPSQNWIYGRTRRRDEIGDLAESFAVMRRQLKRSMDEVNELNRELDGRVHERTQAALEAQLEAQAARDDLRAIIDALSDELIVVDVAKKNIQLANMEVQKQHKDMDEIVSGPCIQVCHQGQPCHETECECPVPLVVMTGNPVRITHVVGDHKSRQKFYKEISASPMRDINGKIDRVVELTRDVTEEKELEESLVRRNQQLSILNAIAMTVNQSLDLEDMLRRSLDAVLKFTDFDVGAVFLQEELQGMLKLMAYSGLSEEAANSAAEIGMLDSSCGGVMDHGQIVIVPDLHRYRTKRARLLHKENLNTLVHVPLMSKGCILGSMCVGIRRQKEFSEEEQKLLYAIGSHIAVGIENARLYAEVQMKERMRGELFMKAVNAQEEERKRIARELHDDTSQSLAAILYAVEDVIEMEKIDKIQKRLNGMHDLVQHTLDGVQKVMFDLRPSMLDHLGLIPAIRWFAESRLKSKGVRVDVKDSSHMNRLPPEVETALFRIVQESILNIARHAAARNVSIDIFTNENKVRIEVEDDGVGFDLADLTLVPDSPRGLGLLGMQERIELLGGELEILSAPGSGTHLTMDIPVQIGKQEYA
jgi:signal transduction histidine kinase/HAMP domain-containing protein